MLDLSLFSSYLAIDSFQNEIWAKIVDPGLLAHKDHDLFAGLKVLKKLEEQSFLLVLHIVAVHEQDFLRDAVNGSLERNKKSWYFKVTLNYFGCQLKQLLIAVSYKNSGVVMLTSDLLSGQPDNFCIILSPYRGDRLTKHVRNDSRYINSDSLLTKWLSAVPGDGWSGKSSVTERFLQ